MPPSRWSCLSRPRGGSVTFCLPRETRRAWIISLVRYAAVKEGMEMGEVGGTEREAKRTSSSPRGFLGVESE